MTKKLLSIALVARMVSIRRPHHDCVTSLSYCELGYEKLLLLFSDNYDIHNFNHNWRIQVIIHSRKLGILRS